MSINNDEVNIWYKEPYELFKIRSIRDFYPNEDNTLEEKLNNITRLMILLTIIGVVIMREKSIKLVITTLMMGVIVVIYYNHEKKTMIQYDTQNIQENFTNPEYYKQTKDRYTIPKKNNPYMNVLLTDIKDNPRRKKAAILYNSEVKKETETAVKSNLDKKLFRSMDDDINFDIAQRQFYSMPNTQIPNNQDEFAKFCYGNMRSDKDRSIELRCK